MTTVARMVVVLALAVVSCAPSAGGVLSWRELTIDLPDGWVELDRTSDSITVGDAPRPDDPGEGERGDLTVATQITVEPSTTADDWRRFVQDEDGVVEEDSAITVAGLPATLIQFTFVTNGTPTRERVVLIPSRQLVLLQQPVPVQGETEGPEWFLAHLDEFDLLLSGITFGAPEGYLDTG